MPATYTLIGINFIIYFLHYYVFYAPEFSLIFGLNALFFNGAWWQVLSTMFVHGSLVHLLMNMAVDKTGLSFSKNLKIILLS